MSLSYPAPPRTYIVTPPLPSSLAPRYRSLGDDLTTWGLTKRIPPETPSRPVRRPVLFGRPVSRAQALSASGAAAEAAASASPSSSASSSADPPAGGDALQGAAERKLQFEVTGGDECYRGPKRSARVVVTCGTRPRGATRDLRTAPLKSGKTADLGANHASGASPVNGKHLWWRRRMGDIIDIQEDGRCRYVLTLATPAACRPEKARVEWAQLATDLADSVRTAQSAEDARALLDSARAAIADAVEARKVAAAAELEELKAAGATEAVLAAEATEADAGFDAAVARLGELVEGLRA